MEKKQIKNRNMIIKKEFAQYYTTPDLGQELISLIPKNKIVNSTIDLGAGEGALLIAAEKRFIFSDVFGVDIDPTNVTTLNKNHPSYKVFQGDSTQECTISNIKSFCHGFDLVIGNPPFQNIQITEEIKNNIEGYNLSKTAIKIKSEVVFLINGIKLLNDEGILAYILPDGFFTNNNLSPLREFICNNFQVLNIREVPAGTFSGTEAKTHILVIKKSKPSRKIKLTKIGKIKKTIYITAKNFINRGDYSFYDQPNILSTDTLKTVNASLIRGRDADLKNTHSALHTTNFKNQYNEFYSSEKISFDGPRIAKPGDIVIPRVGSRCLGKVGLILAGNFIITDCIIIIRIIDEVIRDRCIQCLKTELGINWIKSTAKGVGAKHITLKDLESFPIT